MESYKFIHLSDIHFGQERHDGSVVYHDDVRKKVIQDCKTEMPQAIGSAKVDGVLITGDIAFSAGEDEYKRAQLFIEEICDAGGCGLSDVFLVPGNHDAHRKTNWSLGGHLINMALRNMDNIDDVEKELDRFEEAPAGYHPLTLKFEGYNKFARNFDCHFIESPVIPREYRDLPFDGFGFLRILGINSAIVSDENDDLGKLYLSQKQYVVPEKSGMEYLVMMHHPTTWFRNKSKIENKFNNRVKLLLTGHEHSLAVKKVGHGAGGQQILIESGACNPPSAGEYNYSYTWMEISAFVDDGTGKPNLKVKVHGRAWAPARDRFIEDTQRLDNDKGVVEYSVPAPHFSTPVEKAAASTEKAEPIKDKAGSLEEVVSPTVAEEVQGQGSIDEELMRRIRVIFWNEITWQQRIEILVSLKLIEQSTETKMPYDLEYWALTQAEQNGLLGQLWDAIMAYLPEEKRSPNPYVERASV